VLRRGVEEIEAPHVVLRLFRLHSYLSAIEIGDENPITRGRETTGDAFDLLIKSPPFLDYNDGGRVRIPLRFGIVARTLPALRTSKHHHRIHSHPPGTSVRTPRRAR